MILGAAAGLTVGAAATAGVLALRNLGAPEAEAADQEPGPSQDNEALAVVRPLLAPLEGFSLVEGLPTLEPYIEEVTELRESRGALGRIPLAVGDVTAPASVREVTWDNSNKVPEVSAGDDGKDIVNREQFWYLLDEPSEFRSLLLDQGFAVKQDWGYDEFFALYESNEYGLKASFVTVDSLMHTYHLCFAYLLKGVEKEGLSDALGALTSDLLDRATAQAATLEGTAWEAAALRNQVFLGVACTLLGNAPALQGDQAAQVSREVELIQSAEGIAHCSVTGSDEDYSQYRPRGYYEGDEQLERYFRAMMWLGRVHFLQKAPEGMEEDELSRSALLLTLALHEGQGEPHPQWASVYAVTSFFAGASDDCGFYEYWPLVEAVYGADVTADDLASDEGAWQRFREQLATLPAPRISSLVVGDEETVTDEDLTGFRLMGQRFTLDEAVFNLLTHDNVKKRLLPAALDLPAALGSQEAYRILEEQGVCAEYPDYDGQLARARGFLAQTDEGTWAASLYARWLYALSPLLVPKRDGFPTFMASRAWDRKCLQSYLGSYAELKHDTVLYTKQQLAQMGGVLAEADDRGYVEPEPEVFRRLAALSEATAQGLDSFGLLSDQDGDALGTLAELALRLADIAQKELADQSLDDDEYDLIRSYGGQLEHFWDLVNPGADQGGNRAAENPAAVVVDVATDGTNGSCLELGVGPVQELYVVVPVEGEAHLACGGVFSFYEFEQPISDRLTDSQWRQMAWAQELPDQPAWTDLFTVRS